LGFFFVFIFGVSGNCLKSSECAIFFSECLEAFNSKQWVFSSHLKKGAATVENDAGIFDISFWHGESLINRAQSVELLRTKVLKNILRLKALI